MLQPIHDKLDDKYGTEEHNPTLADALLSSVSRQVRLENVIDAKADEINVIEQNLVAETNKTEQKRLQTELKTVSNERNVNVKALSDEKEKFYREIDGAVRDAISKTDKAREYSDRYNNLANTLAILKNSDENSIQANIASAEMSELALLHTLMDEVDDDTKSALTPIYEKLTKKYELSASNDDLSVDDAKLVSSIKRQNQIVRNIEISTKEIESLENRKLTSKKSEQKQIIDEISMEESRMLDEVQKLAYEKTEFYSRIDKSLTMSLMEIPVSSREEYKSAYTIYSETLKTMKVGLAFLEKSQADEVRKMATVQEHELLLQVRPLVADDVRMIVDDLIAQLESAEPELKKALSNASSEEITSNPSYDNHIGNAETDDTQTEISTDLSTDNEESTDGPATPQWKSLSGYSADMYGIYEMPDIKTGLYYRIQIGAFNVRYKMRDFKGLSLIFTENIPNTNLIRYMTGEFYKYASARENLPKVRSLGFSDAFIVAYYNGKRISIAEARRLEALENADEKQEIPVVIRTDVPIDYVEPQDVIAQHQNNSEENNVSTQTKSNVSQNISSMNAGMTENEVRTSGVYFAVQIGVYKDRRSSSQMFGISPIDYESMPTGYVRHTFGKFADYNQAKSAQMNIRNIGISDAFVIAYIDGRKVSYTEGLAYQKSARETIVENHNQNAVSTSLIAVSHEENLGNVDYEPVNLNKGTEENKKDGVSYYVQIGAFSKTPDPEILSVFSKVAGDKIHVKFPREDLQIYRIGVFDTYEEAQNTLAEARSFGIVDAFIVAFNGDEQISSSEAMRLQKTVRQIEQDATPIKSSTDNSTKSSTESKSTSQSPQPQPAPQQNNVVPAETIQQTNGGVEYYVQLGAFVYTPDPQSLNTFKAIASNEGSRLLTVHNGRFTDYRVGAFKKFAEAKSAVDKARSSGISDAFIVAFYNGQRIPVSEAKEKE